MMQLNETYRLIQDEPDGCDANVLAADAECDGESLAPGEQKEGPFIWRLNGRGSIRLVAYRGAESHLNIPSEINGIAVTSLASNLFRNHTELREISMPDTVVFAGHHVFDGCAGLCFARLSAQLETIEETMFHGCRALASIELRTPLVRLENGSFASSPVEQVTFGPGVQAIAERPLPLAHVRRIAVSEGNGRFTSDGLALFSSEGLYRLVVPQEHYAIPEGCARVEERAFDSLTLLESVDLPASLTSIGRLAFAKTSLREVRFANGLEEIAEKAFFHCTKLECAVLPPSLRVIGDEAFAFSGVKKVVLPDALERLGERAFDHTPAQRTIESGSIVFATLCARMDIDATGGLYRGDTFLELIGNVSSYTVRAGTRRIGRGAFRRHVQVREVVLPEGVVELCDEAFFGARSLQRLELPESIEVLGARALADTALVELHLPARVHTLGDNALVVQGENPLVPRRPLSRVTVDARNERFYVEGGLLCKRDGGKGKAAGDAALLYAGPDHVIRIPDQVTQIGAFALCGVRGIDRVIVHDHLSSVCLAALSTGESVPWVEVSFPEPLDGYTGAVLRVPKLSIRYKALTYLFAAYEKGTYFDFEYYDSWVTHAVDIEEFAPAALYRLTHPMCLPEATRELYEGILYRRRAQVCRYFATRGNLEALEQLSAWGLLDAADLEQELEDSSREGRTQATACVLELRHRLAPATGIDLSL